jgi:hypothetical protein
MQALVALCLLLLAVTSALAAPGFGNLRPAADKVPCYGRAEIRCALQATYNDPFDPAQVTLDVAFTET